MAAVLKQKAIGDALNKFYEKPIAWISLELIFSIGLVLILAVFAIQPTLVTMGDLTKEIAEKKELAVKLDQKRSALSTAQTQMSLIEDKLPELDEAIPSKPQLLSALKVLEKTATDTKVIITSISVPELPEEVAANDTATVSQVSYPISVVITADYLSIRKYIESLKDYKRVFLINSVTFTTQQDRGNTVLQASILLDVPYFGTKK